MSNFSLLPLPKASSPKLRPLSFGGRDNPSPSSPSVLLCSDFDDTFASMSTLNRQGKPVGLTPTLNLLKKQKETLGVVLNTGRGLFSFRYALLGKPAAELRKLVVDGLIVCNGQVIYRNTRQKPLGEWAASLTPDQQDADWQAALTALTGWSLPEANRLIEATLCEAGFVLKEKRQPDGARWQTYTRPAAGPDTPAVVVDRFGDQPAFRLRGVDGGQATPQQIRLAEALAEELLRLFRQKGWEVTLKRNTFRHTPIDATQSVTQMAYFFSPEGVHKGRAFQHYVRQYAPHLQAVIPAGDDDYNDLELLAQPYQKANGDPLPAFPIAAGENLGFIRQVAALTHTVFVPAGQLAKGLKAQLEKIQAHRQAAVSSES